MAKRSGIALFLVLSLATRSLGVAQSAPASPDKVWHASAEKDLGRDLSAHPEQKYDIDPQNSYTLAELIDLAEQHNPETRVAWEEAKAKAASLGIARSTLYPTM